jgi:hypothetical protein
VQGSPFRFFNRPLGVQHPRTVVLGTAPPVLGRTGTPRPAARARRILAERARKYPRTSGELQLREEHCGAGHRPVGFSRIGTIDVQTVRAARLARGTARI